MCRPRRANIPASVDTFLSAPRVLFIFSVEVNIVHQIYIARVNTYDVGSWLGGNDMWYPLSEYRKRTFVMYDRTVQRMDIALAQIVAAKTQNKRMDPRLATVLAT